MRKIVAQMQTTLNNRIAREDGTFWEPFPWGDEEQASVNEAWREADTLAVSRVLYEAIVPWWESVYSGDLPDDAPPLTPAYTEFAAVQHAMRKVVFSRSMSAAEDRDVVSGDLAARLRALKEQPGRTILLAAGPATLGPLADAPGLIDEYLVVIHPAVVAGPQLFGGATRDLALTLLSAKVFDGGCVVLRYAVNATDAS